MYLGTPLTLAIAVWRIEAGAVTRKRRRLVTSPNVVELKVCVLADSVEHVRIGTSIESPESISGTPTLITDPVVLVEQAFDASDGPPPPSVRPGRLVRLRTGASLRIEALPGARRSPLEIETTASGVRHHYSFEIPRGMVFWIWGEIVRQEPTGPFRDDMTCDLAPFADGPRSERYTASATRGALLHELDAQALGLPAALVMAGIVFVLSFIPYAGPVLWGLGIALFALIIFVEWRSARDAAPREGAISERPSAAVRLKVGPETPPADSAIEPGAESDAAEIAGRRRRS
jgi:hypothetical protein